MSKLTAAKSTFLITIISILSLSVLPLQAAIRPQVNPSLTEVNHKHIALRWGDVWDRLRRRKGKRGSRGDEDEQLLCMITPGKLSDEQNQGTLKVWSDRPFFLWQGEITTIEVRKARSQKLVWQKDIPANTNSTFYEGEPLQPGQRYLWQDSGKPQQKGSFRIMEAKEREAIAKELAALENRLKTEGASAEEIALKRANYFEGKELWSDVLREIYSVSNPLSELQQMQKKIQEHEFCPVEDEEKV
ncbi:MAG: hypothetical protein F6K14_33195 [Symploca sp. SIO2C1]|nr:hypothetical protein [Symploca sp. SIO2C1]